MSTQKPHAAGGIASLAKGSFFIGLLKLIADFIYSGFTNSRIGGFFSKSPAFSAYSGASLTWNTVVKKPINAAKKVKLRLAAGFENSRILDFYRRFANVMMTTSLRSVGACLITFGGFVLVVGAVGYFSRGRSLFSISMLFALALVIVGAFCCASRESLAKLTFKSIFARFIFVNVAGIRKEWFDSFTEQKDRVIAGVCIGMTAGLLSVFVPPYIPVLAVVALLFLMTVIKSPEFGAIFTVFALPFLPTLVLAGLSVLTICAFLLKYIRGKRTVKMDFVSFFAALFLLIIIIIAFNSPARGDSLKIAAIYCSFMGVAFCIKNAFHTEELIKKCVYALLTAAFISSLVGLYQQVVGVSQSLIWVDQSMFSDISTRVFGTFDNPNVFGEFIVMLLPFALAMFIFEKKWNKLFPALVGITMAACLIFTYSRGAWLAAIISIALFLMFYSKVWFKLGLCGIAAIPFLPLLLPDSIVNRFLSIGNLADTSTSYRVSIWTAAVEMVKDFWATGTGIGSESFKLLYPKYALSGAQFALHSHNLYLQLLIEVGIVGFVIFCFCLLFNYKNMFNLLGEDKKDFSRLIIFAGGFGALAMLIQGFTDNVWYNYRIFLLFWVIIGIMSAVHYCHRQKVGERLC